MKVERLLSKLETIREEKSLTRGQFANQQLEVSRQTYSLWIRREADPPQERVLELLNYLAKENYGPTFRDTGSTTVIRDGPDVFIFDSEKNGTHIKDPEETAELIQND